MSGELEDVVVELQDEESDDDLTSVYTEAQVRESQVHIQQRRGALSCVLLSCYHDLLSSCSIYLIILLSYYCPPRCDISVTMNDL